MVNHAYGPVLVSKYGISDGIYHVNLNVEDIPKLGVDFSTTPDAEPLVAFPLVLKMGWKLEEQSTRILYGH